MTEARLIVADSESNSNLYYKTRFLAGDPFIYVERDGAGELVVSPMERGRAQKESTVSTVKTFDDYGYRDLAREYGDRTRAFNEVLVRILDGVDNVTVEGLFPVMYADALRAAGITVNVDPRLFVSDRRAKSQQEIAAIEEAQRATERAVAAAIELLSASEPMQDGVLQFNGIPLTCERLRAEIENVLAREGMEPGSPIVAAGTGAADPHFLGSGPIRRGEAIVMDVFPRGKHSRYYADMTRTVVKGEPSPLLRSMYDAVLRAQELALSMIRPGVNGREIHEAVERVFEEEGFAGEGEGPRYIHGTGHGVGLDIHEGPSMSTQDAELAEGDVVTVEPGLYDPAVGGIRIEDLVVVTANGSRNLTDFPKRFEV